MPRIPPVEPTAEPEELRTVFDQLRATRGRIPTMYGILAHQPEILAAHRAYFHAALDTGTLPRAFKEKVAFKVALECGSAYSTASHRRYALRHGVTEEELAAIERSEYGGLAPHEQVALEFADEVVRGALTSDATFQTLRTHFSSPEIVEFAALVGIMQLASTLGAIFDLQPDADEGPPPVSTIPPARGIV
ncbi:MAG TPA: carboxymuconolactone decarboxylase family protein [Acidimicrobiia bacterium]|nr:carboxymuconolactone decarboxylase family protein [Acidimicrobiia bacterium]